MRPYSRILQVGLFCTLFAVVLALPANAQFSLGKVGVSVGGNFDTLDDLQGGGTEVSFESAIGYNVGVTYDQPLGTTGLSVRPGLLIRRVGTYQFASSISRTGDLPLLEEATLLQNKEFTVRTVEVPVDLLYRPPLETGPVTLYGLLGPQLSVPRAEDDFETLLEDVVYSLNVGVGGEVSLPAGLVLAPELRYEFGLTDTFKEESTYRFREFMVQDSPSTGALSLRLHLYYDL